MPFARPRIVELTKLNRADIQSAVFLAILLIASTSRVWGFDFVHRAFGEISSAYASNLVDTLILIALLNAGFLVLTTYRLENRRATERCALAEHEIHR